MSTENSTTGTATNNKKKFWHFHFWINLHTTTHICRIEQFLRCYALHEAIQVEKKYHATLHVFNQSQQQPKPECTPNPFLERTHTRQHYENNEAFQKNESIIKTNPEEIKISKNEKKESEESSNANSDFHWPDGNISFQFPSSQLMEDGWAYFRYALCPLYSTKATPLLHQIWLEFFLCMPGAHLQHLTIFVLFSCIILIYPCVVCFCHCAMCASMCFYTSDVSNFMLRLPQREILLLRADCTTSCFSR